MGECAPSWVKALSEAICWPSIEAVQSAAGVLVLPSERSTANLQSASVARKPVVLGAMFLQSKPAEPAPVDRSDIRKVDVQALRELASTRRPVRAKTQPSSRSKADVSESLFDDDGGLAAGAGYSSTDIVIHFDGGCENSGEPGCLSRGAGSYGFTVHRVCGGEKTLLVEEGGELDSSGIMTNNVAEWSALAKAIEWVEENVSCCRHVVVHGDSQLVISQLLGKWATKKPHLKEYRRRCRGKLDQLVTSGVADFWKASWIPREQNKQADMLGRC